jgi:hypothetical protein
MDIRTALKGQYKAALAMLRDCIVKCPDDLWAAGSAPLEGVDERQRAERESRAFWRIAYHVLYGTHLYAMRTVDEFVPWSKHVDHAREIWIGPDEEVPPLETTYTQADVLEYLDWMVSQVDDWVDAVDLDSPTCGVPWYDPFPKLDHAILVIRHIGTHVGQLSERLNEAGIDTDWVSRR